MEVFFLTFTHTLTTVWIGSHILSEPEHRSVAAKLKPNPTQTRPKPDKHFVFHVWTWANVMQLSLFCATEFKISVQTRWVSLGLVSICTLYDLL